MVDLYERTGPWLLWRFQVASGAIIDASFKSSNGPTREAINTNFETLLETVRQISMLSTILQLRSSYINQGGTQLIDAFQLSQKTFRSYLAKFSDTGFSPSVDAVGFLSVRARLAEKFSLDKWTLSASSSFCVSRLVSDAMNQSMSLQISEATKAIRWVEYQFYSKQILFEK